MSNFKFYSFMGFAILSLIFPFYGYPLYYQLFNPYKDVDLSINIDKPVELQKLRFMKIKSIKAVPDSFISPFNVPLIIEREDGKKTTLEIDSTYMIKGFNKYELIFQNDNNYQLKSPLEFQTKSEVVTMEHIIRSDIDKIMRIFEDQLKGVPFK